MGKFGERLQREREMRGITLEEIAAATKISTRSLHALEEQEFDKLPGGVFNKGFVRAYSRFLGIDEEQAVADYVTAYEADAARSPHKSEVSLPDLARIGQHETPIDWRRVAGPVLLAALLVTLLAGGWFLAVRRPSPLQWVRNVWKRHSFAAAEPAVAPATPLPVAPPARAETPSLAAAPGRALGNRAPVDPPARPADAARASSARLDPGPGEFVVQLRAHRSSHVSVRADGQEVMNGTLIGAELEPIRARQQVVITAETPSAVQYSFNGQPFRLLGRGSEEQTLTFTAGGIQR